MSFIHLHVYSAYSLLNSTVRIEELVKEAKSRGFNAVALTDRNVMHGSVHFYKECLKLGIKPILGLTADIISSNEESYPLVLLAKNREGFQNLLKISSVIKTKSSSGIPLKWLKHYQNGLIAITPGLEGEIEKLLLRNELDKASETIRQFVKIFGKSNFYLSIQDHQLEAEKVLHPMIIDLSTREGVSVVATNQVFYLNQEDSLAHESLLAIKNGDKLQDNQREKLESDQYYFKSRFEMTEILSQFPDALENTIHISLECNVKLDLGNKHLPKYPVVEGQTADSYLKELCFQGLYNRKIQPPGNYITRLNYELDVIKKMKFSDYFLIVWDFMRFAHENGILTGPGRGSAAGSLVAFVLRITEVDPIEHELLFERFLNPDRISMPDIDIDFPDHLRDEVINYVVKKYGELHVAQIVTFGTLAAKAALRDVGRAFGLNPKELEQLSKLVPSKLGITLSDALKESPGLTRFVQQSSLHHQLYQTAIKLEGLPRHTSTHAAGIVISEDPLVNRIPIQTGHQNVFLTQYSMEYLEDVGLLKMDFLGLRNLTLIDSILKGIDRVTKEKVSIMNLPLNDHKTFELLSKGDTTGIFQLESEGMRKVLMKLKPSQFEDIVAVNALYRPGPMENIPVYIERKHGLQPIEYPHSDLIPILDKTYGVIVYQEQIMQIASKLAGFSLGEADLLRRAVSKKQKEVLDQERKHFVSGAIRNGYDDKAANDIYDLIVKFANYGFNRSHAVAYSIISYQLAYLKAHYPLFFLTSLLTSAIGNDTRISQYIREAKDANYKILPPSINRSGYTFLIDKGAIRYSLSAIKGIGAVALKEIFQKRKGKPFEDLFDFCMRVSTKIINRKILESLVHSGSFDEFGMDRATLLASLDVAIEHSQFVNPDDEQFDMFSDDEFLLKPKYVQVENLPIKEKLKFEKEVLGVYLSDHPLSIYEKELINSGAIKLVELNENLKKATLGIFITEIKKIRTKKGEAMAFLTISDSSGEMEAVVFPTVYSKLLTLLEQGQILVVEGKLEKRSGAKQFIIQGAVEVNEWLQSNVKKKSTLYIKLLEDKQSLSDLNNLKQLLKKYRGKTNIVLFYEGSKRTIMLEEVYHVTPSQHLLAELKNFLGNENVILKE